MTCSHIPQALDFGLGRSELEHQNTSTHSFDAHMQFSTTLDTTMHDLSQMSLKRQKSADETTQQLVRTRRHEPDIEECIRQLYQLLVLAARECVLVRHAQRVATMHDGSTTSIDMYVEPVQGHKPLVHSRLVQPSEDYSGPRTAATMRVAFYRDGVLVLQGYSGFAATRPVTLQELLSSA